MKFTMYPFKPIQLDDGQITILETGSFSTYTKLVNALKNEDERLAIVSENDEALSLAANTEWYGDPMMSDLDALFKSKVQRKLVTWLDTENRDELIHLTNQMNEVMTNVLYGMDLPIMVSNEWDLLKCIKFLGIQFTEIARNNPYDIIESIIKVSHDLRDTQVICLTNVFHYLDMSLFSELAALVERLNVKVFIIEFSDNRQEDKFGKYRYYYIDSDMVEW